MKTYAQGEQLSEKDARIFMERASESLDSFLLNGYITGQDGKLFFNPGIKVLFAIVSCSFVDIVSEEMNVSREFAIDRMEKFFNDYVKDYCLENVVSQSLPHGASTRRDN